MGAHAPAQGARVVLGTRCDRTLLRLAGLMKEAVACSLPSTLARTLSLTHTHAYIWCVLFSTAWALRAPTREVTAVVGYAEYAATLAGPFFQKPALVPVVILDIFEDTTETSSPSRNEASFFDRPACDPTACLACSIMSVL